MEKASVRVKSKPRDVQKKDRDNITVTRGIMLVEDMLKKEKQGVGEGNNAGVGYEKRFVKLVKEI